MNLEHFQALEDKINQLLNHIIKLKEEKRELIEANHRLEARIKEVRDEKEMVLAEKAELENKVKEEEAVAEHETEIKSRVEALLSKVDEVVGS